MNTFKFVFLNRGHDKASNFLEVLLGFKFDYFLIFWTSFFPFLKMCKPTYESAAAEQR